MEVSSGSEMAKPGTKAELLQGFSEGSLLHNVFRRKTGDFPTVGLQ
jgi:hypothetical protein